MRPPPSMALPSMRSLVPFVPSGPDSSTTVINSVTFSLQALRSFKYSLYANGTISNDSTCYLIFDAFKPSMLDNGTWIDATSCYISYYGIGRRGKASIAFGACFGIALMLTLVNLGKHGKLHLRESKRFRAVGRRWQWYWMLFVAASGMVSTLTGVDVERYFLQQIPIVLQSFFFILMVPAALAMVWEGTRHWGSWEERQIVDSDPYGMPQDDKRSQFEFYLPLVFYLFAWLEFFLTIPRSWTPLEQQNTPWQVEFVARPAATGTRGKAGALLAVCAWLVIVTSLVHSARSYKAHVPGTLGKLAAIPLQLPLNIALLGVRVAYGIAAAWAWDLTIFRTDVNIVWPFALGYGPLLAILVITNVCGFLAENEDKLLLKQRIASGRVHDAELNLVKKPNWWHRRMALRYASDEQRMQGLTTEVAGASTAAARSADHARGVELAGIDVRQRIRSRLASDAFRDESPQGQRGAATGAKGFEEGGARTHPAGEPMRLEKERARSDAVQVPQQRIRSMLDV